MSYQVGVNDECGAGSTLLLVKHHSMLNVAAAILAASLFAFAGPAKADLAAFGPVDPATGFPNFIQDANNVQIGPCDRVEPVDEDGAVVNNAPCPGTELEDPGVPGGDPGPGFVVGNIVEFTYYRTEANIVDGTPNGERFRLRIEVQGGILPPESINNAVRLRLRNLVQAGTYLIDTPFNSTIGQQSVEVVDPADDVDIELPGGVLGTAPSLGPALGGNVMCFWSNGTQTTVDGQDFLGDGVAEQPLVPITGNAACPQQAADLVFRITFPDGTTVVESNLFTVEAKLFDGVGVLPVRSVYERNTNGNLARIDLWVKSVADASIVVSGTNLRARTMLQSDTTPGSYYLRQRVLPGGSPVPSTIDVAGATVSVVDAVTITRARHNVNNDTLDIRAVSSDAFAVLTLTVTDQDGNPVLPPGPNELAGGRFQAAVAVPPGLPASRVTVTSSQGGSATLPVDVRGGNISNSTGF